MLLICISDSRTAAAVVAIDKDVHDTVMYEPVLSDAVTRASSERAAVAVAVAVASKHQLLVQ
jgi:hypothetical protein